MLRGRKVMSEIYVRRIPLDEVPDDDQGSSDYLHELYRSKVNYYAKDLTHECIIVKPIFHRVKLH